jgi:hypothetical protein
MRQFLYISKTKIEGLEAGLWRRHKPEITLSASAPGGLVKLDVKPPAQVADLYRRTDALIRKMERRKQLVPMPEQGELGSSDFYHDDAVWANGLFSFKGDFSLEQADARVVTYLLWRRWQDSIVLLAGSPLNVLGEHVVREGVWAYGTTGTLATLVHFTETALRTDEENVVGVSPSGAQPEAGGLNWTNGGTGWPSASLPDEELRPEILSSPPGLALAALCLGHLAGLPAGPIETTFRITQRIAVNLRGNVPRWAVDLLGRRGREQLDFLRRCQAVYVGSPLYTALP